MTKDRAFSVPPSAPSYGTSDWPAQSKLSGNNWLHFYLGKLSDHKAHWFPACGSADIRACWLFIFSVVTVILTLCSILRLYCCAALTCQRILQMVSSTIKLLLLTLSDRSQVPSLGSPPGVTWVLAELLPVHIDYLGQCGPNDLTCSYTAYCIPLLALHLSMCQFFCQPSKVLLIWEKYRYVLLTWTCLILAFEMHRTNVGI